MAGQAAPEASWWNSLRTYRPAAQRFFFPHLCARWGKGAGLKSAKRAGGIDLSAMKKWPAARPDCHRSECQFTAQAMLGESTGTVARELQFAEVTDRSSCGSENQFAEVDHTTGSPTRVRTETPARS